MKAGASMKLVMLSLQQATGYLYSNLKVGQMVQK